MIHKTAQINNKSSFHCLFDSFGFKSFKKLVNAGGLDVIDVKSTSRYIRFTEGVTLLGGGINNPKLGEARYSDINPGIDDYYENNICVSTKNNRNWLLRAGGS